MKVKTLKVESEQHVFRSERWSHQTRMIFRNLSFKNFEIFFGRQRQQQKLIDTSCYKNTEVPRFLIGIH